MLFIMEYKLTHYEFINSLTGNVIGYLSLAANLDKEKLFEILKQKQAELAIANKLYVMKIYWQEKNYR